MITRTVDQNRFRQRARQVKARVPAILSQWGLTPKFNRWRLAEDPASGMVVLFAVLNVGYIAAHTASPLSEYFDPRLLNDFANDLHVQVVSCNSDGPRYAFILDRGQIDVLPTHIEYPFLDGDRLYVRVVHGDTLAPVAIEPPPEPRVAAELSNDQASERQGVEAFLKVLDDVKQRDSALRRSLHESPKVVVIEAEQFNERVAEYKTDQKRISRIKRLFNANA